MDINTFYRACIFTFTEIACTIYLYTEDEGITFRNV